jgi:solute carrier family 25 folate transporter 32
MYRHEGIASFYSGLTPALLGLTHVAIQFPLYEYFKMKFTGYGMGDHPVDEGGSHWAGITAATFLSKICASTATYPHEVIRTRLQTQQKQHPAASPEGITHSGSMREPLDIKRGVSNSDGMAVTARYKGIIRTCKVILHEEGWRAFYAGIGTNLVRAVPAAMVTMITYEWLQSALHHAQDAGEEKKRERDQYTSTSA